jgi:hypothetical protein
MEPWKISLGILANIPVFAFVFWLYFGGISDFLDAMSGNDPADQNTSEHGFAEMKIAGFVLTCFVILWAEYAWFVN